jgi:hypothetical protein
MEMLSVPDIPLNEKVTGAEFPEPLTLAEPKSCTSEGVAPLVSREASQRLIKTPRAIRKNRGISCAVFCKQLHFQVSIRNNLAFRWSPVISGGH